MPITLLFQLHLVIGAVYIQLDFFVCVHNYIKLILYMHETLQHLAHHNVDYSYHLDCYK